MAERAPASGSVAQRHRAILDIAAATGNVAVEPLAAALGVTPQTVRRDLNALARADKLTRVHGGAVPGSGTAAIAYRDRQQLAAGPKRAIGAAAAALVPDGASLFLDIGTTAEAVAAQLAERQGLLVISNNLNAVDLLAGAAGVATIVVGGRLRGGDRAVVGPQAAAFVGGFRADIAVIGASAIADDGWLLDYDEGEVAVMQAMIANARTVVLVADATKVGRAAPLRIAPMAAVAHFVTDVLADAGLRAVCAAAGVNVIETG